MYVHIISFSYFIFKVDKSKCKLAVQMENKIIKGLPKTFEVVERESAEFPLEVRDPNTPVDIFVNGENIKDMTPAGRMELENKGNGKFLLKVHKIKPPNQKLLKHT